MKKHQYSLLLNIKTIQVIDKIAETMDRSRNNMVQHILSKYVVDWLSRETEKGNK